MIKSPRIPVVLLVLIIVIATLRIAAQQEEIRYGGGPIITVGSGPMLSNKSYRIKLLSQLDTNGTYPITYPNSTFNWVSFNGTHLTFLLRKSSSVIGLDRNYSISLSAPFLIILTGGSISEISIEFEPNRTEELEILEAKVGGSARIYLTGELLEGSWISELGGWLLLRNWSNYGELSALLLFQNMTRIYFKGITKASGDSCTLEELVYPYKRVYITVNGESVNIEARGSSIEAKIVKRIILKDGMYVYSGVKTSLIEVKSTGEVSYGMIEPESCGVCEFGGKRYVYDSGFSLEPLVETSREIIGGNSFQVKLTPPQSYRKITILFEGTLIVIEDIDFPLEIIMRAPIVEGDYNSSLFVTAVGHGGIFGQKVNIRILPRYAISLMNSSMVYLIGGRGYIAATIYNYCNAAITVMSLKAELLTNGSQPITLVQPIYQQIPPNSSLVLSFPLDLPIGDYSCKISINLTDSSGNTYTLLAPTYLKIKSIQETPLSISAFVVPDSPNLGDEVRLFVSLSPAVPLDKLIVNVSSTDMDPLSDTSKLLVDIKEGSTIRMEFSFRAKALGSSFIKISAYYLPKGRSSYEMVPKEIPVYIGKLSGKVHAEINETKVSVGDVVEVRITVEGIEGEVTLEFPRGAWIIESQGVLIGNKLKIKSPSHIRLLMSFNTTGNFTIPSIATVNGTRILQVEAAKVSVLGGALNEREGELRSKLVDLTRRYRTLVEMLRVSDQELNKIEQLLNRTEELLSTKRYSEAEEALSDAERMISAYEQRSYNILREVLNFLIYFLIGAGLALLLLIFRRMRKGDSHWR